MFVIFKPIGDVSTWNLTNLDLNKWFWTFLSTKIDFLRKTFFLIFILKYSRDDRDDYKKCEKKLKVHFVFLNKNFAPNPVTTFPVLIVFENGPEIVGKKYAKSSGK